MPIQTQLLELLLASTLCSAERTAERMIVNSVKMKSKLALKYKDKTEKLNIQQNKYSRLKDECIKCKLSLHTHKKNNNTNANT